MPESTTKISHPSRYIQEEMGARRWDRWELARRMGGDPRFRRLELDLYFEVGPDQTNMRLGKTGADIARAFGVSHEFLLNLELAWLAGSRSECSAVPDRLVRTKE